MNSNEFMPYLLCCSAQKPKIPGEGRLFAPENKLYQGSYCPRIRGRSADNDQNRFRFVLRHNGQVDVMLRDNTTDTQDSPLLGRGFCGRLVIKRGPLDRNTVTGIRFIGLADTPESAQVLEYYPGDIAYRLALSDALDWPERVDGLFTGHERQLQWGLPAIDPVDIDSLMKRLISSQFVIPHGSLRVIETWGSTHAHDRIADTAATALWVASQLDPGQYATDIVNVPSSRRSGHRQALILSRI